jgi:cold shock CspA family protein
MRHTGQVVEFDADAGLGSLAAMADAIDVLAAAVGVPRRYRFHCTAIADGSRSIEVGRTVNFAVVPGRLGSWEASDLRPV